MKNRQKLSVSEKNLPRRDSLNTESSWDTRIKKKISSNPLVQKNINFLQTYNNLFRRTSFHQTGEAENFFKSSLRSEPFDLIRDLNIGNLLRPSRSLESVSQYSRRKPRLRSKRTLLSPKRILEVFPKPEFNYKKLEEREPRLRDIYIPQVKDSGSDSGEGNEYELAESYFSPKDETESYFSPKNEFVDALEKVEQTAKEEIKVEVSSNKLPTPRITLEESSEYLEADILSEELSDRLDFILNEEPKQEIMGEADEMQEVEKMIAMASKELKGVAKENKQMMDTLESDQGSYFKYNAAADAAILRELDEAECEAKHTAGIIAKLKDRVTELTRRDKMTEVEAKELEELNLELKNQMIIFEQKTKKIQELLKNENLFSDPGGFQPSQYDEDVLPKVVVCGLTENCMPKLLICDDTRSKCAKQFSPGGKPNRSGSRSRSRSKEPCPPCFPCPPCGPCPPPCAPCPPPCPPPPCSPCPPRPCPPPCPPPCMPCPPPPCQPCPGSMGDTGRRPKPIMPCGPGRGPCPADIEARLQEYSQNTQILEHQLYSMENEVKTMHKELLAVQREREHLEHHRKMLCPASPCIMPTPCPPGPCPPCMPPPPCRAPPPCMEKPGCETQLKELREQYKRLQDDFKSKLTEVAGLRAENEKLKEKTRNAEDAKKEAEKKARELDNEIKRLKGALKPKDGAAKEQMIELQGQLDVAKQRFREAQDELDELRLLVDDQQKQLDDYRNKYLEAQQTVEEQRRQIDMMEMENQRISEQVNLEIQRVKNQFQEKLQELMPLPDILKATQIKLQEAQQMHLLAERNNEAIARELQMYKDKVSALAGQMEEVQSDSAMGADATATLQCRVSELEEQLAELQALNNTLLTDLEKCQESCDEYEKLSEERLHEVTQLEAQLEGLREETARQVARIKDRCEIVRRSMQKQIGDLERQLAQSRAMAKSAQKDRDEIRCKMQAQINNLNENFEDAQMRIKNLQGHVNFLKNTYGDGLLDLSGKVDLPEPCECAGIY